MFTTNNNIPLPSISDKNYPKFPSLEIGQSFDCREAQSACLLRWAMGKLIHDKMVVVISPILLPEYNFAEGFRIWRVS